MIGRRKYLVNDDFFDTESPEKYWLIGLLASDGSIGKYNQVKLSQSGEDGLKLVQYVKSMLEAESPIRINKTSHKNSYELTVSSQKIVDTLAEYNVVRNKTLNFTMPKIPYEFLDAFIAGYIEGDGCVTISKNKDNCHYLSVSFVGTPEFVNVCQYLIPIRGTVRKHNLSNVYEIRWYGKQAIKVCRWIYQNPNLYHGYKYKNYEVAEENYANSRESKYNKIKSKVLEDFQNGISNVMKYASEINVPFQTIYKWKNTWMKEGLL